MLKDVLKKGTSYHQDCVCHRVVDWQDLSVVLVEKCEWSWQWKKSESTGQQGLGQDRFPSQGGLGNLTM